MLDSSCFGRDFVFAHLANLFPASQFNALMADFVPLPMISINEFVAFLLVWLRLSHCNLGSNKVCSAHCAFDFRFEAF